MKSANSCWWVQLLVMTLHYDIVKVRASNFSLFLTQDCKFRAACSAIIFGSRVHKSLLYRLAMFSYYDLNVFQGLFKEDRVKRT